MAHGAGPRSNGNRVSAGRYWHVRSTNMPYFPPQMCGGRVLLSGTRGGPTSNGNRVSVARWWCVHLTNTPYVPPWMCGGRVLLSGTRGGADVKRGLGLRRALVACPLNQHTLRPAADMWGAGITEWHTGRGRRQTGTGSLSRAGGVSAQPTHPTSRRGCVGGA